MISNQYHNFTISNEVNTLMQLICLSKEEKNKNQVCQFTFNRRKNQLFVSSPSTMFTNFTIENSDPFSKG